MNKKEYMDKPQPRATYRCLSATNEHIRQGYMHSRYYRMLNDDMPEGIHIVVNGSGKSRHARTAQRSLL